MARTFTTLFSYRGSSHMAVISQTTEAIRIYVPDESLHGILPEGRACFSPQQGLKVNKLRLSPAQHLILKILISTERLAVAAPVHTEVRA